jgi:CheY-like chemotaxis protein
MPIKLLLADDSITIHKVVQLTFAAEDVLIDAVTQGDVAIERARQTKPDIVLADVFMPGRNGYEVCATIKEDPQLEGTPVVLLVGTFEPFDEMAASRAKCDAYLTKPFDTAELIDIVRSLVEQHDAGEAEAESTAPQEDEKVVLDLPERAVASTTLAGLVSDKTRESFLGSNSILDLFDSSLLRQTAAVPADAPPVDLPEATAGGASVSSEDSKLRDSQAAPHVIPFPGTRSGGSEAFPVTLTDEVMDLIVEKVVKRMSQEVVREIAWEVVPELSQIMIRQYIDELKDPKKS